MIFTLISILGVVHVSFQEDSEGNIHMIAHPSGDKVSRRARASDSYSSSDGENSVDTVWETAVRRSPRTNLVEAAVDKSGKHRYKLNVIIEINLFKDNFG